MLTELGNFSIEGVMSKVFIGRALGTLDIRLDNHVDTTPAEQCLATIGQYDDGVWVVDAVKFWGLSPQRS